MPTASPCSPGLQWMHTPDGWKDQVQFQYMLSPAGSDAAMVERSE